MRETSAVIIILFTDYIEYPSPVKTRAEIKTALLSACRQLEIVIRF